MKQILFLLLVFTSFIGFSQTKDDVIDFKNLNTELLNKLIFEECNKVRVENNVNPLVLDKICGYSSKYQSEYMSNFNILTHINTNVFQSHLFERSGDRFEFFYKKYNEKRFYVVSEEVCTEYKKISTTNYTGITTKTYQNYSQNIVNGFMGSRLHRLVILDGDDEHTVYGSFKVCYNPKTDNLYVAGVINPCLIIKKVGK